MKSLIAFAFCLVLGAAVALGAPAPAPAASTGFSNTPTVFDTTGTVTQDGLTEIRHYLESMRTIRGVIVHVAVVNSLPPGRPAVLGPDLPNHILLVVAPKARKSQMIVGPGLSSVLTQTVTDGLLHDELQPYLDWGPDKARFGILNVLFKTDDKLIERAAQKPVAFWTPYTVGVIVWGLLAIGLTVYVFTREAVPPEPEPGAPNLSSVDNVRSHPGSRPIFEPIVPPPTGRAGKGPNEQYLPRGWKKPLNENNAEEYRRSRRYERKPG